MSSKTHIHSTPVAKSTPFDNTSNSFVSTDTQAAIEEVNNKVITSASPGFSFGRTGVSGSGTYMQCETVPSNVSGRWVYINNAVVKYVYAANELATTYSLTVSYHDGNNAGAVDLGTVTVTAAKGAAIAVNWPVPLNKQIAVRVADTTANSPKNVVVGLQLQGTS
jgi:hypothetical protein